MDSMAKKTIHQRRYFQLLQLVFLGFFIFFIILGIRGIVYGEGEAFVGFVFAAILAIVYWLIVKCKLSIRGFAFGIVIGILLLFVISRLNPGDDIAGIVIFTLLSSGLFFSFIGRLIQNHFWNKK